MFITNIWTKKKKKVRLSENQINEIIEIANEEREFRRIIKIVYDMVNKYDGICDYIGDLHNMIDKLLLEINYLENSLVHENIQRQK